MESFMAAPSSTESVAPASGSATPGYFERTVWWRFVLAVSIVVASTAWALTTRSSGVETSRHSLLHWKFWLHPVEWNPDARKPYLQGDLRALAVWRPPEGKAWVYFGGADGFAVRRGLDDEEWEPVPLPKSVATRQNPSDPATGAAPAQPVAPAGGAKK